MSISAPRRSGPIIASAFAVLFSQSDAGAANWLATCWLPAEGRLGAEARAESVRSNQEIVIALRDGGLPISAIAEMMGVERKTIYAWLDGSSVRDDNAARLQTIYQLLSREVDGDFRRVYRVWNQVGPNGQTLRGALASKNIDPVLIRDTLASLRSIMEHYAQTDARKPSRGGNPALDELPVADSG